VTVLAKPRPDGKALAKRLFGMTLRPVTPVLAGNLRLPMDWGLMVVGIEAGSPADKLGIKLKDILFQVDRFYVKDLDGLGIILEDLQAGQSAKIGIARGYVRVWASIRSRQGKAREERRPASRPSRPSRPTKSGK
jgi:S1-C subfamily serine protease